MTSYQSRLPRERSRAWRNALDAIVDTIIILTLVILLCFQSYRLSEAERDLATYEEIIADLEADQGGDFDN